MASYNRPRGTEDLLPEVAAQWHWLEEQFRSVARRFNFGEIRTPTFEQTELFKRSVGETTDIVGKEMYTFEDRGGRSFTLRPEGTAPVVRAYVENKLFGQAHVWKLFYFTSIFRYERPQAGRLREAHQAGVELLGAAGPNADIEVIALAVDFFQGLGLTNLVLVVNSIGCPACRPAYREALVSYFDARREALCETCLERFEKNPLRILDCKSTGCQVAAEDAPVALDHLCEECAAHFEAVKQGLDSLGVEYEINPRLVRGLDYYTKTAFEVRCKDLGAQNQVAGGGRYDGLVEQCGGPATPAVGFALGIERTLLALEALGKAPELKLQPDVYLVCFGEAAVQAASALMGDLRKAGLAVESDLVARSPKKQLKLAADAGASYAVIIGEDELARGVVTLKELATGEQAEVTRSELASELTDRIRKEK